jgi:metal-responsive CopG/Arc/MetJ family transcriptional regulator
MVSTARGVMKTAISLPDPVFEEAESLAKQLGVSRSELYTKALKAYLQKYNHDRTLNKLNQIYSEESSEPDPVLTKMQFMSLPSEDW